MLRVQSFGVWGFGTLFWFLRGYFILCYLIGGWLFYLILGVFYGGTLFLVCYCGICLWLGSFVVIVPFVFVATLIP